jgi:sigma-B regulation protein RsbU (phosphoserine phosphatase)
MSPKPILASLQSTYPEVINALADHWLKQGAEALCLCSTEETLAHWGQDVAGRGPGLSTIIRMGSIPIGELIVWAPDSPTSQSLLAEDSRILATLAQQYQSLSSTAIELVDTRDQLLAFYEITKATRDCWDIDQTMQLILIEITKMIKAEAAFLVVDLGNELSHIVQTPISMFAQDTLYDWARRIRIEGRFIILDKGIATSDGEKIQNMLLMPIRIFDESTGMLGIVNKAGHEFMSPDIKLLNAITEFAGTRLEIVIMYKENLEQARLQTEMALAHDVQYQLLPKQPPTINGLDLWASYQPASLIGGDFYDFIVRPEWPFTFSVGDVSGKGIPAALLMTATRTIMRMAIKQSNKLSPEAILRRSNTALYEDLTSLSMIVTAFVAQYFPSSSKFIFANAGHSPVIYLPGGKNARLLPANETALGVFNSLAFNNQTLELEPGDIFFVGSDGLSQTNNNPNSHHGYEYILDILERNAQQSAEEIGKTILEAGRSLAQGSDQEDDQTIVIIKKVDH